MRIAAHQWTLYCLVFPRSIISFVSAYEAASRWGQATVVIYDALFVYGGKTDEFNQFSYTSAPNINDILLLPLSSAFSGTSPPWELVSSSTNLSTSQGPALAWSTLSAFNDTEILLFGGQYGVDSATSSGDAQLLDVYSRIQPSWATQLASQPPSRMRHSTATASSGSVFIFGGEKADGSGIAFSDHFYFDPTLLSFSFLPTLNAPPDIYGHASIILSDGRILVFGGYSPSQGTLLPFSTIWVLDTTQSTLSWNVTTAASTALPSPRAAFAAVLISNGKIIIHGGSDAAFQTNFADGWVLDTTQSPMTWTAVDALSQLGGLRDHFAASSADEVIFGFGYAASGPAPAALQIFNTSSGSFISGYTPPSLTATPTQTLPRPSQTQPGNTNTHSSGPHGSAGGIHPTSTVDPSGTPPPSAADTSGSSTTAIAVGLSFGLLSLLVVGLGATYYLRRRRSDRADDHFIALGADDEDEDGGGDGRGSPHFAGAIPTAGMREADPPHAHGLGHGHGRLLSSLGITGALAAAARMASVRSGAAGPPRRDMLADEDARSLREWYAARRADGSAGSSWSLLNMLGGTRRSRNASTVSRGTNGAAAWREKRDPFSDGAAAVHDEETGFIGAAAGGAVGARPRSRREMSYASSRSAASYRDPFLDPLQEAETHTEKLEFEPLDLYRDHEAAAEDTLNGDAQATVRYVPPLPPLRPVAPPLAQLLGHPLSPLSERTSQSTLPHNFSSSASSHAHASSENIIFSPATGGSSASRTSLAPGSPRSATSLLGASSAPDSALLAPPQPVGRSDSWWAKFARTSLRERRASDAASRTGYDIRDPTPAPAPLLAAIEERSLRASPPDLGAQARVPAPEPEVDEQEWGRHPQGTQTVYAAPAHGKSASSVRTADTAALERLVGAMDVAQRVQARGGRWGSGSTSSQGARSVDTQLSVSEVGDNAAGGVPREGEDLVRVASPVDEVVTPPSRLPSPPPPPPVQKGLRFAPIPPPPPASSGSGDNKVSERIRAYERRMSESQPTSPAPTNSKHREERAKKRVEVDYGLVPRPSLFIANPDHRLSTSDDS